MNIYYNILSIFSNNYVSFFPSSYVFECKENANKSKGVSTNRFSDLPLKKKKTCPIKLSEFNFIKTEGNKRVATTQSANQQLHTALTHSLHSLRIIPPSSSYRLQRRTIKN